MTSKEPAEGAADEIVTLEFDLADRPEKVWRALSEPEIVARWIAPDAEAGPASGETPRHAFLDAESGRRVSYRWRDEGAPDGIVTFSIAPAPSGGTRLTVVHSRRATLPVAVAGPLACRVSFAARRQPPAAHAANSNRPLARAA